MEPTVPRAACDEFQIPAVVVGLYDVVLAFDHVTNRAWIVSQGLPEVEPERRQRRAADRIEQVRAWLQEPAAPLVRSPSRLPVILPAELAAQHPVGELPGLTSNFSRDSYLAAVRRAIEYVRAGDIFQVNLAQRLLYPAQDDAVSLYRAAAAMQPSPLRGLFRPGRFSDSQRVAGALSSSEPAAASRRGRSKELASARRGRKLTCSPATSCSRAARTARKT